MSQDRDEIIAERAAASMADFMENGPRFWVGRQTYVLARGEGDYVLLGGVGAMGTGTMWSVERGAADDPTYAEAPFDPEKRDDFGATGRPGGGAWDLSLPEDDPS